MNNVIVAGAGIIGSTIAWRLAQRGWGVTLLDAGQMGGEASTAGAGMLCCGVECARSEWGSRFVESLAMYGGFVDELTRSTGIPIDYRVTGGLELAATETDFDELRAYLPALAGLRTNARLVDRDELTRIAPALVHTSFRGGLYLPDEAQVDPRDVMRALRAACLASGVRIEEHCRVTSIEYADASVVVGTERGSFTAGFAIASAGAWTSAIAVPRELVPSFPVKGHLVAFDVAPGSIGPLLRHGHTYVFQRNRGTVIAGSNEERVGFDRTLNTGAIDDIVARARALVPGLLEGEPVERWSGLRPGIDLARPLVERLGNTPVWVAYGHYRNGILLAPATANMVADELTSIAGTRP